MTNEQFIKYQPILYKLFTNSKRNNRLANSYLLYGDINASDRVGVVPFNIEGIYHREVGQLLQDMRGIAVRTGCFCAQPYVMRLLNITSDERYKYLNNVQLPSPGMIRASFGLYNTEEEVDEFLNIIEDIVKKY